MTNKPRNPYQNDAWHKPHAGPHESKKEELEDLTDEVEQALIDMGYDPEQILTRRKDKRG